jgi:DNA ligase-1
MIKPFKPLLASPIDYVLIDWADPTGGTRFVISYKLDGIRALVIDGVVMSRKLIPIPNEHVQRTFGGFEHFDGELICGDPTDKDAYSKTYSAVMKKTGEPDVTFHVFDHIEHPDDDYCIRLKRCTANLLPDIVRMVPQVGVNNERQCRDREEYFLGLGYEGAMLRLLSGPKSKYKFGRSTAKECTLLKIKNFTDSEATIIGFEEEMANNNEATLDELGRTKRSSHAENKVGKGRLGALVCLTKEGVQFNIGSGFTAAQREDLWAEREALLGTLTKFKHFLVGAQTAPRFPIFLGLRSAIDI